jgi:hypothetical protein
MMVRVAVHHLPRTVPYPIFQYRHGRPRHDQGEGAMLWERRMSLQYAPPPLEHQGNPGKWGKARKETQSL